MARAARKEKTYDVIVIGAGASGMMAAGRAAEAGARVLLLEKMDQPGKKILLSGKTRCNLSNVKDLKGFIAMFGENGPFLYRAFHDFPRESLLSLLNAYGLETKVERGGRIFPVSDQARDVVRVLRRTVDLLAQIPYCEAISDQLRRNARRALGAINRFPVCEVEDLLGASSGPQDKPDEQQQAADAHDGVDGVGVGGPDHGAAPSEASAAGGGGA